MVINKPKPRPKPTVEEVEDEDDLPPEKNKANSAKDELPYRNIEPIIDTDPEPVLPRKPGESNEKAEGVHPLPEKAYRVSTELDDTEAAKIIRKRILDMEVPVKVRWMIAASNALQKDLNQLTTKKRRPLLRNLLNEESNFSVKLVENDSEEDDLIMEVDPEAEEIPADEEDGTPDGMIAARDLPFDQYVFVTTEEQGAVPEGAVLVEDAVVQYYESLGPGEEPKGIFVGKASEALRCLFPLINGRGTVESLLDSGSQICSITEEEAVQFKIPWDPDVTVYMQGSTGKVERTLGLARNVPFNFGRITIFLQLHVLRSAPYKLLLGRPFEVITEAVFRNGLDGKQTITMTEPVSKERVTIPTAARGEKNTVHRDSEETKQKAKTPKQDF